MEEVVHMTILFSYTYKIQSKVYQKTKQTFYKQKLSKIDFFSNATKVAIEVIKDRLSQRFFLLHTFFIHLAFFIVNLNDSVQIDCCKSVKPVFI